MEGFDPDRPLFVASGIFADGAMDALAETNMAVVRRELASHVFHKNQARSFAVAARLPEHRQHVSSWASCKFSKS